MIKLQKYIPTNLSTDHDLNIDVFNKSSKKLITNEDKFWSSFIDYHSKTNYIWDCNCPHNITKSFTKMSSPLLGAIRDSYIKNSGNLLNRIK